MRKTLSLLVIAAAAAFTTSALAESSFVEQTNDAAPAALTGAVAGTAVGLGVSEGWFGTTVAGTALPTTVAGAAAVGGVVGIGSIALIDSAVERCRGFQALFGLNRHECVNGVWVGYAPPRRVSELRHRGKIVR
jgi:hypothetical protein